MVLRQLIDGLGARLIGDAETAVRAVRDDSRQIEPGDVFVAVRGLHSDGHAFVASAIERGAAAIVVERELDVKVPQVIVASTARALGVLVARAFGEPAKTMTLVGITGTNGKTTTTYLVESILAAAGAKPGVIGTVDVRWAGKAVPASYTTPTPAMLHGTLAQMRDAGCTHVVMEVTSIALAQERAAGLRFAVAAFSNLTQDHLDIHGTMDAYRDAKRRLFRELLDGTAVVNIDDPAGDAMADGCAKVLHVSADGTARAEIRVAEQESTVRGIRARIATPRGELAVESKPLVGHYNVANIALAVGIAEALGISHDAIARGIAALPGVPGRVERVANSADLDILVDYAHTPDALRNVLTALRPLTKRRLICVFGCGGDRDPTKRPKMGAAVAELADLAVVTSDNPRTEDPRAIVDQILPAVPAAFFVDVDRRVAIRAAIAEATPGDVVVIAGKGHETYQILGLKRSGDGSPGPAGTTKVHFDDREEAAAAASERELRLVVGLARDAGGEVVPGRRSESGALHSGGDGTVAIDRVVIDSRAAAPGALYVAIRGETHDGHAFCADAIGRGARAVMVDHRVDLATPQIVVKDTRLALGALARAHRRAWDGKLVAITGSAGKTTTKELARAALAMAGTTHAAAGSLNNETGVPLTLLGLHRFHEFGVVEMGMRGAGQIEYLTKLAEPDVAVVVNAGSAHIELLGSTDAIAKAKAEIWLGLRPGGTIVRPAGDDRLERRAREHRPTARHVTFGDDDGADVRLVKYEPRDAGSAIELDAFGERRAFELQLVGRHAAIDACAALAAAHAAGASLDQAIAGLRRARPPAMRGELVELAGRKVIVDCYNANPASMAAALRALAERAHGHGGLAIIGDMLELGAHAPDAHRDIGALAKQLGLGVIALGEHARTVVDAAADAEVADSPATAATRALARSKPGDWLLLKASRGMRLERVLEAMRGQG
ncbi:MAG TPA: UDP-N-acetylmuramoyl-L-alanyl-D-glutamate--2,6-diaminopimelate ligase [Kofleriaceae bacterium]|nr:UDP-N-acetylmuramoyl-L-alanyl-D-glutamate--2,6-diaminopimelate ligase [Kofleriaceae bacterium]